MLPYAALGSAGESEQALTDFLQSSFEAAADLVGWDRASLEREVVAP